MESQHRAIGAGMRVVEYSDADLAEALLSSRGLFRPTEGCRACAELHESEGPNGERVLGPCDLCFAKQLRERLTREAA